MQKLTERFRAALDARLASVEIRPRFNIAPSQSILAVRMENGERVLTQLRWGLVPSWSKEPAVGSQLINARAETVRERLSYRELFRTRRCLVPCSAFYEWAGERDTKQPYAFARKDGDVFGIAALWDSWRDPQSGATLDTATLITTQPNALVSVIHDRMPAILREMDEDAWLNAEPDVAATLLTPFAGDMRSWPVSRRLNSAHVDEASLISPVQVSEQTYLF